ncbi:DUF937 domain-containing protein [Agrococcus sp. HG114]|uniref:DUF937 domain-containing protein n=1 Tax=Agrococcus sp. HG114 TaxID=2969757 RepID=UPI00215B70BB|nr:DUF937 domain-containing protein [Agrococcus sp. HG114]MCR8671332.1 DUF937 domain-containing protein [Agrococcus sp. HG114]
MSEIQQLMGRLPVQQIAERAGVGEEDARRALEAIVPTLVGGMQANASDPAGAQSLMGALGSHAGRLDERLAGDVDPDDGEKIVHHVFGDSTDRIAQAAGGGGALGGIIRKILPIVAPMVMAWIANRVLQGGQAGGRPSAGGQGDPAADSPFSRGSAGAERQVQLPGGSGSRGKASGPGGGLGDLLGGLLGGGSGRPGDGLGPLGDVLGGLLGGGRR